MITDQQVRRLRRFDLRGLPKERAADKAGIDAKTARKYRRLGKLPSEVKRMPRDYRTRPDPFDEVWPQVQELLQGNPGLEAKTLFAGLPRRFPGRFDDGQLRTLQRRIKQWRALAGPAKEVFFAQVHHPGRLCASDLTHCSDLHVTIAGTPFEHLLYHFVLTYCNWETATICFAESYESLSEGLQNALWELGGVPQMHRTDWLTAAIPPGTEGSARRAVHRAASRRLLESGRLPNVSAVEEELNRSDKALSPASVAVAAVELASYDALLTSTAADDGDDEWRRAGEADGVLAGIAPAGVPVGLRGVGVSGVAGDVELRAVPVGPGGAGVPGASATSHRASAAGVAAAAGEELVVVAVEASAGQGGAADAVSAGGLVRGSSGERAGLRCSGFGEDAFVVCVGTGVGAVGSAGAVLDDEPSGAGVVDGQTRSEIEPCVEASVGLRSADPGRPGLRAAEPRGDGSIVHAVGGALRAGQCIDRLVHHCVIVELNIASYRVEQAKREKHGRASATVEEGGG